VNEEFKGI